MLLLELVVDLSCLMKLAVMALSLNSYSVAILELEATIVPMLKMLESDVNKAMVKHFVVVAIPSTLLV